MQEYLQLVGAPFEPSDLKDALFERIVRHKEMIGCDLARLAAARGHEVVFLPPKFSRWNPIELYWGLAKNKVAMLYSSERNLSGTRDQLLEALDEYGTSEHTNKLSLSFFYIYFFFSKYFNWDRIGDKKK